VRFDDPRNPEWIPKETIGCIERYVSSGLDPGDFVQAILSNDLMEACKRADENNLKAIVAIAQHVYSHVPRNCYGTKTIVRLWIELGSAQRLNGSAALIDQISEALYEALGRKDS